MLPDSTVDEARPALGTRGVLVVFAFWTFLALLSAASRLLDPRGFGFRGMSPAGPILLAFVESWLWAALTPAIFWLGGRVGLERRQLLRRILVLIGAGIAIAIVVYLLLAVARDQVFESAAAVRRRPFRPAREIASFRFVPQLLFYFAILAAGFAREYFLRVQQQQAHSARLQAQLAEARLDALRMQINPHFLFNTLHAVSAMVERNPSGVRKMIARLSELLRHTIDTHATDEVPLRDELEFLGRYVEIMEIRFQGRLTVERRIDPATTDALVPNLILQPIVENALEHGVSRNKGPGVVEIASERRGDVLVLTVRDNGPGIADETRTGVGLTNTRARLSQLYGEAASVQLSAAAEGGTVAEIALPFRTRGVRT
ncbi:MAG: two-component system, LytTR family, sensor kinase [Acidobacteriota bacterium]|jgi:signal transduction histidine kinase|nr:two-component system, LytTR family, sensor kinase [Acidobacteriota bacterium]